jgi:hypothetical protein
MWCAADTPGRLADEAGLETSRLKARREEARSALLHAHRMLGRALDAAGSCERLIARSDGMLSRSQVAITADRYRGGVGINKPANASVSAVAHRSINLELANRCLELARAPGADRVTLAKMATLFENRGHLAEGSRVLLSESRELLSRVDELLNAKVI